MKILIVDPKESVNYDFRYMDEHALGGTESTVLRIAAELAKEHEVCLAQLNRDSNYHENEITYIPFDGSTAMDDAPDVVIILRKYRLLPAYRKAFPKARLFVWVHNYQRIEILARRHHLVSSKACVICVSQNHREHIDRIFNGALSWLFRAPTLSFAKIPVKYIYNLIDPAFKPAATPYSKDKLFFFSTANKGLDQVLDNFRALLAVAPDFKLYIANNTRDQLLEHRLDRELLNSESVIILGKIPRSEVIRHLQDSLCVFYPQSRFTETFGLVYVEANCTGTPVLAHRFGSAEEVIENTEQFVDADNPSAVVKTILQWRDHHRPNVACPPYLVTEAIMAQWRETLGLD